MQGGVVVHSHQRAAVLGQRAPSVVAFLPVVGAVARGPAPREVLASVFGRGPRWGQRLYTSAPGGFRDEVVIVILRGRRWVGMRSEHTTTIEVVTA